MKRQSLRKGIILLSFLLFPITIYYFSPYLVIQAAAEGIISGSFIVFSILFIISLFFGRAFCGWLCPTGGIQECMLLVSNRKARGGKLNYIKYVIWIPWIISIILLFAASKKTLQIDFFYQTVNGISVLKIIAYFIYYIVLGFVLITALIGGRRAFCHYFCWMAPFMVIGSKIKKGLNYRSLQLKADKDKCIECGKCTKKCPMSIEVVEQVKKGSMYNSECILCGECIDTCPKSVIRYSTKP